MAYGTYRLSTCDDAFHCFAPWAASGFRREALCLGIGFVFVSYSDNRVFSRKNEYSYSFFVSEYETNLFHVFLRVTCTMNFDYEGLPIAKLEKKISHVRPMSLVILARALVSCRP